MRNKSTRRLGDDSNSSLRSQKSLAPNTGPSRDSLVQYKALSDSCLLADHCPPPRSTPLLLLVSLYAATELLCCAAEFVLPNSDNN